MIFRTIKTNILGFVVITSLVFLPLFSSAQGTFDKNMIIADEQLITYQTMSPMQIQQFLERKGGYIANFFFVPDGSNQRISAAQHIYNTGIKHRINPKFLLVMLQKEMGLIEEASPKQTQLTGLWDMVVLMVSLVMKDGVVFISK